MGLRRILGVGLGMFAFGLAPAAMAQTSPIMIESGPSNNPEYRRMITVKYLVGDRVNVNYETYTRSEFRQTPNLTSQDVITACSRGSAVSLSEIRAFEKDEAKRKRRGEAPVLKRFCIKNVPDWEAKNRDRYLDPIFNGMPLAPK